MPFRGGNVTGALFSTNLLQAGITGVLDTFALKPVLKLLFWNWLLEMRCSKSCYLCDLGLADLFDVVEQVVFFRNDFLIDRTADIRFHVAVCFISLFQAYVYFEYRRER